MPVVILLFVILSVRFNEIIKDWLATLYRNRGLAEVGFIDEQASGPGVPGTPGLLMPNRAGLLTGNVQALVQPRIDVWLLRSCR